MATMVSYWHIPKNKKFPPQAVTVDIDKFDESDRKEYNNLTKIIQEYHYYDKKYLVDLLGVDIKKLSDKRISLLDKLFIRDLFKNS